MTSTHVLSTLEQDGSRRWLYPRLSTGRFWHRRRWVGYALIAFFVALPHARIAGKPPVLLDIPARQVTLLGYTFLPTDTLLLAFGMLSVFLAIMLATALSGRVWCGWACPQTVYMEYLFRPIDRLFEGTSGRGGNPRRKVTGIAAVARIAIYLVLSMLLAHTFLSYFVGTDRLAIWIRSSPWQHPIAFVVMAGTTLAMLFDFLFFREQLCLIACPYGRFQSVMLDRRSLIVGYDRHRGEPRGKLRKLAVIENSSQGDCVDCKACVAVCPTGIDIRDGLQMECINCTQCIDACDEVMDKIGKPRGLIRYSSQDALAGKTSGMLRPRTLLYPIALAIAVGALAYGVITKSPFDLTLIRGAGNPYTSLGAGLVQNSIKLRIVNRTPEPRTYAVTIEPSTDVDLEVINDDLLTVAAGKNALVALSLTFKSSLTSRQGRLPAEVAVTDDQGVTRGRPFQLLGPKQ